MSAEHEPRPSYGDRLDKWIRDSAELQAGQQGTGGVPALPEEAAQRRYRQSRTRQVALPHPSVSPAHYDRLTGQYRGTIARLSLTLLAMPLLVVLGLLVGPLAAQVAIWALLVPLGAYAVHQGRSLPRLEAQRHLSISGGLADAWADWAAARARLEALGSPSQARAALAANEPRMQSLVLALARADAEPGHQDTEDEAASRAWVYESAAKATALAQAEQDLEDETRRQLDAEELRLAPDGDIESLDHALDTARTLNRPREPRELPPAD